MQSVPFVCPVVTEVNLSRQLLVRFRDVRFCEGRFSGSRIVIRVESDGLSNFDRIAAAMQMNLKSTRVFVCNFPLSFFVPSKIHLGFKFFCIPKFHVGLYISTSRPPSPRKSSLGNIDVT